MAVFVNESLTISGILSQIGYNGYMRTIRQNAFKCMQMSINKRDFPVEPILSGSKAEGLSSLLENDVDAMLVNTNIVCSEYPVQYCTGQQKHIFRLSKRCSAPGYATLQLSHICETLPEADLITDCLVELLPGRWYISSDIWKNTYKQAAKDLFLTPGNTCLVNTSNENHGPSFGMSFAMKNYDIVETMPCYCPSYLYSWKTRHRHHNWPTAGVIEEVSEMESHVVPVGNKNSPLQFMEWRICYTKGEILLIRSLPDCLTKLYILMKALVKVTLKPLCNEISSYIIKNIVLWIAELNPIERFSERNLVTILQHAFKFMKTCLLEISLPSYMIPERNLFAERLTLQQRSRLCMRIDSLLREGPRVVLRVKKMQDALNMLYRTPEEFRLYFKRRQIIEVLSLMLDVYTTDKYLDESSNLECVLRNMFTDDFTHRIVKYLCRLVPALTDSAFEGNGETIQRIDPDFAVRFLREADEDYLIRINPVLEYLS